MSAEPSKMEQAEMLVERLNDCAASDLRCGECAHSPYGCGRYFLLRAAADMLYGFLHPESSGIYDIEEIHENVTVEVWKNSITGELSVGWYDPEVVG